MLGFWIYLMSDCLIFAILFATFGVLGGNYAAGPAPKDLFDLPLVAVNTSMLLLSSITYGFAMLQMEQARAGAMQAWLAVTGLFGLAFIGIELSEFAHMIHEGATPQRSAFLSSFFTLVGTHGLHVTFGLVWLVTLMIQVWQLRPDRSQPAPADVPQHVLALPRRRLDRRLHLRLSDGDAPMSTDDATPSTGTATRIERIRHGSLRQLSDRLRAVGGADRHSVLAGDERRARQQADDGAGHHGVRRRADRRPHDLLPAHEHHARKAAGRMMALIFTVIMVVIALTGSLWVMYHLNGNMMPVHDMSQMP